MLRTQTQRGWVIFAACVFGAWSGIVGMVYHHYHGPRASKHADFYHAAYWHIYKVMTVWTLMGIAGFVVVVGVGAVVIWWYDNGAKLSKKQEQQNIVRSVLDAQ